MSGKTKEEKFLMAVGDALRAISEELDGEVDRYVIGQNMGLHPRGINTICNQLAQANFIKKLGPVKISLTENGKALYRDLRGL
jgi:Mn-dependent DtxR family transcriptional regulator